MKDVEEEEEDEEGCLDDKEGFSSSLPRFQKLLKNIKNLSQLFGKLMIKLYSITL